MKQNKLKTLDRNSIEFAKELFEMTDKGMDTLGQEWNKAKTRHEYIISNSPFKDMNELREWHEEIGYKLEMQIAEERKGTPEERYYMFKAS